jgi:predicted PurR-regulated permease PerM
MPAGFQNEFARRTLIVIALLAGAALVWYTAVVLLLAFSGVLLAILLDAAASWAAERTGVARGWAFLFVVLAFAAAVGVTLWQIVPRVIVQVNEMVQEAPQAISELRDYLQRSDWGRAVLSQMPQVVGPELFGKITLIPSKVFEAAAGIVVVLVTGLYMGADPELYRGGLLRLAPEQERERANEILEELGYTLRWWILGQLVPMLVLGIATSIGLWMLGMRLAFTLGLLTGVMVFIPYLGSLIAFGAAMLVAAMQGFTLMLYVAALFLAVHAAEGYVLTPLVQKRAVHLPPALTILAQVFMGMLLGFLGLALATPLAAALLVVVKMLYLGERPEHHH